MQKAADKINNQTSKIFLKCCVCFRDWVMEGACIYNDDIYLSKNFHYPIFDFYIFRSKNIIMMFVRLQLLSSSENVY